MKCPSCNKAKAKRSCLVTGSQICSLCCGTTRTYKTCHTCSHYKVVRNYSKIPHYYPVDMNDNDTRAHISNVIESTLCNLDNKLNNTMTDMMALSFLEKLFDILYFGDNIPKQPDLDFIMQRIQTIIEKYSVDEIVKIIGAIYFVAKRRVEAHGKMCSDENRVYINFIQEYVGATAKAEDLSFFKRLF